MEPQVAGELGVERGDQHRALAAQHRVAVDAWPAPRRRRRPRSTNGARMNTAWNGAVEAVDVEVGLEGVDLAAEGVAAHGRCRWRRS